MPRRCPVAQMAVIVRGQGRTATLRRVLMAAGVPVAGSSTDLPVRDEVAVLPPTSLGDVLVSLMEVRVPRGVGEPVAPLPPAFQPLPYEVGRQLALDPSHGRAGRGGHVARRHSILITQKRAIEHHAAVLRRQAAPPL